MMRPKKPYLCRSRFRTRLGVVATWPGPEIVTVSK